MEKSSNSKRIKSVSGAVSFQMNKSKGQHLLKNPMILQEIINKSSIKPTETVLEIGPGTGNLTMLLLEKAKKVIAIEIDPRMVASLLKRVGSTEYQNKLQLICGDVLKQNLPPFDLCVANIPYQISSPIVFKLLSHRPLFKCAVLLIQREFAMRLIAKPNSEFYCRLSVNVQLLSKVEHLMKVSKKNFTPPPKVESSVIRIEPKSPLPNINYTEWDEMLKICFGRKNKTLGAIFKQKKILDVIYNDYKLICENKLPPNCNVNISNNNVENQGFSNFGMDVEDDIEMNDGDNNNNDNDDIDNEDMKDDEEGDNKNDNKDNNKKDKEDFKNKINNILTNNGYVDKRAIKLDIDAFLNLLNIFNNENIHFLSHNNASSKKKFVNSG